MIDVIGAGGRVVCLCPRFGWKHDSALPLKKVCWRRATPDAATTVLAHPHSVEGGRAVPASALERCRSTDELECSDYSMQSYGVLAVNKK